MCCGKKLRIQEQPPILPKGLPPPPFQRTSPPSPPPLPRATIAPKSVPRGGFGPPSTGLPDPLSQRSLSSSGPGLPGATIAPQGGSGGSPNSLTIKEINEVCPKCASKLGIQLRYSDRLRRHYEVKWCPACKEVR